MKSGVPNSRAASTRSTPPTEVAPFPACAVIGSNAKSTGNRSVTWQSPLLPSRLPVALIAGLQALPDGLVSHDRRGRGDVERVGAAEHRNPHADVCTLEPVRRQANLLGADGDDRGPGQVNIGDKPSSARRRGH